MTDPIVEFLTARYDELAQMAQDRLCIVCGHPVKERYVEMYGLREWRGYEHDERRDSTGRMHRWHGVRCEGGMTGAEPVQRPDLVLADLAAKRRILARHGSFDFPANEDDGPGDYAWTPSCDHCSKAWPCPDLRDLASTYAYHPDFDPAWRIDG